MLKPAICVVAFFALNISLRAQEAAPPADLYAPGENIYRHYTGTIGGKNAVIDLRYGYQGAANYGGSTCYFTDEGSLNFFTITKPNTTSHIETLRAQVFPEHVPLGEVKDVYSIFVQTPRFECNISHDTLTGKWYNPNAQDALKMMLTEDKRSAARFDFLHAADSAFATAETGEKVKASLTYNGVDFAGSMKAADRTFIRDAFSKFEGGGKTSAADNLAKICFQNFIAAFSAYVQHSKQPDGSNYGGVFTLFPVFYENGLLVLQEGGYQYDFDHKEYTDQNRYLCLDLSNRKTLKLDDVLTLNDDLLNPLLEKAFRNKYQLEPGKKLSDLFLTDKIPVTGNFIPLKTGLIFSYSPMKIFRDDQDISELQEMRLFLSYNELGSLLKPEFKKRMGMK